MDKKLKNKLAARKYRLNLSVKRNTLELQMAEIKKIINYKLVQLNQLEMKHDKIVRKINNPKKHKHTHRQHYVTIQHTHQKLKSKKHVVKETEIIDLT